MHMEWQLLVVCAVSLGLLFLLWYVRGVLLTPIRLDKSVRGTVVLRIVGPAPSLEQTVDSLRWLQQNGTLPMEILVIDAGMDETARRVVTTLARRGEISLH